MSTQLGDDAQYHVLPWWKRIVLDKSFRQNIRRLATSRYREEMRTLEHFPEQLAPVVWDDGKPLSSSSQYICLESDKPWSTRHPQKIVNVSSVRTLHNAAEGFALPSVVKSHEECVKQEMQALFDDERWGDRLYGLSYIWRDQLPPLGFIREWPDPHAAMWPPYLEHSALSKPLLPCNMSSAELKRNPQSVHVYRSNGQFLGVWRQSQLMIRFKIICWSLHEEARKCRKMGHAAHGPLLENVPNFSPPLMGLQRGTVTLNKLTGQIDMNTIHSPTTWEGLAPSPPLYGVDQTYLNWKALHNSVMVRQSVRDIFDLLPRNEASQLTKETFVEFVLDLLNLFFPVNSAASNLAIAEEEWVYRGTNEMMSFDTFYERFFTFPFIFLRDIDNVSRNEYIEVWSLIRICLLENAETIWYSALEYSPETTAQRLGQLGCKDANAAGKGEHDPQDVVAKGYRGGGVRGDNNKGQGQHIVKAMKSFPSQRQVDFLPLLCGVGGVSKGDIYRLGGMNFHNSDNYKLFNAKRIVAEDYAEALSVLPASQRVAVVHKRGEWLLKKLERGGAQQYSRDEEEHESNIAGSVVSSDATVSSTKTVSYSSAGTQREDMKQRHANVDAFDRQQELNRLLKSSLWYRRCCERNHQSVVGTDVLIIRSHTSWDMYQHDTYAIPREKPSDVDNLIAFVQNLPDEFFDEVDSLRMRESIYRSGLDARMGRIADASQPLWAKDGTTPELKTLSLQRAASGSNAHSSDTQSSFIQPTTNNSPRAFSENGMSDPSEVCNSHFVSYLTATLEQQYKVRQEPPKPIIAGHKTAQRERLIKEEEERKERRKETRRMNVRQRLRDRLETEFVRYIESNSKRANLLLAVDRMRGKKA